MRFCKVIQIKSWVNRFNKDRQELGYANIEFKAVMFRDGKWAVTLTAKESGLFFSDEMERICTLYAGGGFSIRVFAVDGSPVIDMQ